MNFQTMSKQRKFILIAAAIGVIATFLPWWSFSTLGFGYSVNGFHGLGVLAFLCFVGAGVMAYMDDQTTTLGKTKWMATLIAGAVAALIILYYIIETSSVFSSLSLGIYLAALAAAGIVISAFLFKAASDNLRDGFGSLKGDLENRMKNNQTNTTTTTNTTRPPSDTPGNMNPPM
jgi:peptidoglycan/LPS O-acetylase OafA/YrhL